MSNQPCNLKGQLILKANSQAIILPKNEGMNSFLLLCNMFLFIFWKKLKSPKRHFEINWPLTFLHVEGQKVISSPSFKLHNQYYHIIPGNKLNNNNDDHHQKQTLNSSGILFGNGLKTVNLLFEVFEGPVNDPFPKKNSRTV